MNQFQMLEEHNSFKLQFPSDLSSQQTQFFETKMKELIRSQFKPVNQKYVRISGPFVQKKDVYCMLSTCLFNKQILEIRQQKLGNEDKDILKFRDLQNYFAPEISKAGTDLAAAIRQTVSHYNSYENLIIKCFQDCNEKQIKQMLITAINKKADNQWDVQIHQINQQLKKKTLRRSKGITKNLILIFYRAKQTIVGVYYLQQNTFKTQEEGEEFGQDQKFGQDQIPPQKKDRRYKLLYLIAIIFVLILVLIIVILCVVPNTAVDLFDYLSALHIGQSIMQAI